MSDRFKETNNSEEMKNVASQMGDESEQADAGQAEQADAGQAEQAVGAAGEDGRLGELEQRIAEMELQAEEYKESWMRAAADFRNLKRRTEQERQEMIKNASAGLILKLLPIVDDMERAMEHAPREIADNPWFEGMRLVQRKLQMILDGEGVRAIEAQGQEFDPTQHEAVMYEEGDPEQSGKVIAELQKGYKLGDRVLRPTMVKVGR